MRRVKAVMCAGVVGLVLLGVLVLGMTAVGVATAVVPTTIHRTHDPVIVSGADLPGFDQVPIDELRLYIFDGADWLPIPMQIDERVVVTGTAVYTSFEDGLLDANDELVFMGHDAGLEASIVNWVNDAAAQSNARYAVAVTDPLQPSDMGYAYLYRSDSLVGSVTSYVAWGQSGQTLTALSYTLSFDPDNFVGVANLRINGNPQDILDRQKIRVDVDNPFPLPDVTLNEEDVVGLLNIPATVTLPIVGQVRAVGGGETNSFAFYGRRSDINVGLDLDSLPNPIPGSTIAGLRTSLDLNDPTTTNMGPATYYDSNTLAGVAVDGTPDAVPTAPLLAWSEISGAAGGMVTILGVDVTEGTVSNYYLDDDTPDGDDTGDQLSFADSGVTIADPGGVITVAQAIYIVSPGQGSQGSMVKQWYDNPLQAEATEETFPADEHVLTVAKTAAATVAPGGLLTYTLTVEHFHVTSSTYNLVLTDVLPLGTTFITATGAYTDDGVTGFWTRPALGSSETWQVQLVVQVPLTPTATMVENLVYGVRSDEVETAVWGDPVTTDIVAEPEEMPMIYLPFIQR
ncbi:MAG: DUF11 domain-containing protein [Ardenticatenaceae bacterium]|nr:DUF11 domain-containing protein [Ardenticatenaceae bacterium]